MSTTPAQKEKVLDRVAEESGVAVVVVDAEGNDVSFQNNAATASKRVEKNRVASTIESVPGELAHRR